MGPWSSANKKIQPTEFQKRGMQFSKMTRTFPNKRKIFEIRRNFQKWHRHLKTTVKFQKKKR
jgi:hypothetical protein